MVDERDRGLELSSWVIDCSLHVAQWLGARLRDATRCSSSPDSLTEHSLQVPQVDQVVAPASVEWLSTGTLGKAVWLLRRELPKLVVESYRQAKL